MLLYFTYKSPYLEYVPCVYQVKIDPIIKSCKCYRECFWEIKNHLQAFLYCRNQGASDHLHKGPRAGILGKGTTLSLQSVHCMTLAPYIASVSMAALRVMHHAIINHLPEPLVSKLGSKVSDAKSRKSKYRKEDHLHFENAKFKGLVQHLDQCVWWVAGNVIRELKKAVNRKQETRSSVKKRLSVERPETITLKYSGIKLKAKAAF